MTSEADSSKYNSFIEKVKAFYETHQHEKVDYKIWEALITTSIAWGWTFGVCMMEPSKIQNCKVRRCRLSPFSILPSPMPRQMYELADQLSPLFQKILVKSTMCPQWLISCLESSGKKDADFTGKLLNVAKSVYGTRETQREIAKDIKIIMFRSDYMVHTDPVSSGRKLSQVELNTISLSFASLAPKLTDLHRMNTSLVLGTNVGNQNIPTNLSAKSVAEALAGVSDLYCSRYNSEGYCTPRIKGYCFLFVVREDEVNEIDQRHLEFSLMINYLQSKSNYRIFKKTLQELSEAYFESQNKALVLGKLVPGRDKALYIRPYEDEGFWEVTVLYYRTGYDPKDYPNDGCWEIRRILELADAVKCPNILTHLAGVKKMQQLWCREDILSFLLDSAYEREFIKTTFQDQVDLSEESFSKEEEIVINEALEFPEKFVLKPLREGGMHNFFGKSVKEEIIKFRNKERTSPFILMRKIFPEPFKSAKLPCHELQKFEDYPIKITECVSEFGMFGIYLMDGTHVVRSQPNAGYLLRTKDMHAEEGGVVIGAAFLDSPFLID